MKDLIAYHYGIAFDEGIKKIEKLARATLRKHKNLDEFIMGMGHWFFTTKDGENISWDSKLESIQPLCNLFREWDNYLKLTGHSMRFTARGEVIEYW